MNEVKLWTFDLRNQLKKYDSEDNKVKSTYKWM